MFAKSLPETAEGRNQPCRSVLKFGAIAEDRLSNQTA